MRSDAARLLFWAGGWRNRTARLGIALAQASLGAVACSPSTAPTSSAAALELHLLARVALPDNARFIGAALTYDGSRVVLWEQAKRGYWVATVADSAPRLVYHEPSVWAGTVGLLSDSAGSVVVDSAGRHAAVGSAFSRTDGGQPLPLQNGMLEIAIGSPGASVKFIRVGDTLRLDNTPVDGGNLLESAGPGSILALPNQGATPFAIFRRSIVDSVLLAAEGGRLVSRQIGMQPLLNTSTSDTGKAQWVVAGAVSLGREYLVSYSNLASAERVIARVAPDGKITNCRRVSSPIAFVAAAPGSAVVAAGAWDKEPVLLIYSYGWSRVALSWDGTKCHTT